MGGSTFVNTSDPYFIVVGTSNGYFGQELWKIGEASGWRAGAVNGTCIDYNLTGMWGYIRTVRCTNQASNYNADGDSGGPLFLPVGGPYVYLSGTTNGHPDGTTQTNYSTISQIQLDFSNALAVDRVPTLSSPSVVGTIPSGVASLNWSPIAGAAFYQIYKQTDGVGPFLYHTTTSSPSYTDVVAAIAVLSGPPPGGGPYVTYYVKAQGGGSFSTNSNFVFFQKPPLISVTIQGQFEVKPLEGCYWTAAASGGSGSYSYQWTVNGNPVGPNYSYLV